MEGVKYGTQEENQIQFKVSHSVKLQRQETETDLTFGAKEIKIWVVLVLLIFQHIN